MVGIASTYALQTTFFVAWLAVDQARIDARRDGACCWVRHGEEWKPNRLSQRNFLQEVFGRAGRVMVKPVTKVGNAEAELKFPI